MDVMFVSPRGPKHKYFRFLAAKLAFNSNVYEALRDFIISQAELEGITIDEHVLNNSLHPMQENEDQIDEIVDVFALLQLSDKNSIEVMV